MLHSERVPCRCACSARPEVWEACVDCVEVTNEPFVPFDPLWYVREVVLLLFTGLRAQSTHKASKTAVKSKSTKVEKEVAIVSAASKATHDRDDHDTQYMIHKHDTQYDKYAIR